MADMYSNPLPPTSMRSPPSEPPQTPKSNADFRALLATPRAERGSYHSSLAGGTVSGSGERKEKKDKPKKPQKPKPAGEEEKKDEDADGYRCVPNVGKRGQHRTQHPSLTRLMVVAGTG